MDRERALRGGAVAASVVVILASVASLAVRGSGRPRMAAAVLFVDVTDGTLYEAKTGRNAYVIPERNPRGEAVLMPVARTEAGYAISPRHLASIDPGLINPAVLDPASGIVVRGLGRARAFRPYEEPPAGR